MTEKEHTELVDVIRFATTQMGRGTISTAQLQIKFLKGYNWADKMINALEELQIIGEYEYLVGRKVLVDENEAEEIISNFL